MKGNGITGDPAIARNLGLCSPQIRCYFTLPLSITAGDTEMSVSLSPLAAIRLGGELLDGACCWYKSYAWYPVRGAARDPEPTSNAGTNR